MAARRSYGTGSVHQRKDGMWIGTIEAGWTAKGTRRRITISAKDKRTAQQKLRDKEREIARNGLPTEGARANITVKEWGSTWLPMQEARLRPSSYTTTKVMLGKWIIPAIGHTRLAQLSPGSVRAIENDMFKAGRAASSVIRARGVLTSLLRDAMVEGGHQVPDAVFKVPMPENTKSARDAIPLEDALTILQVAITRKDASRWVAALLQAMRPAEARGLTWDHVDFENDIIDVSWQLSPLPYKIARDRSSGFRVPRNFEAIQIVDAYHLVRPKTDSGVRRIPLVPWMKAALLQWRELQGSSPYGLVWTQANGRPLSDKKDIAAWKELCAKAKVGPYDLYESRHTAATLLRRAGVDDETIIAIMGHATILSTKAYLHTDTTRAREALDKVAATLQLGS